MIPALGFQSVLYALLAGLVLGTAGGYTVANKFNRLEQLAAQAANQKLATEVSEEIDKVETKHAQQVDQRNEKTRVVLKEVVKYVENDSCDRLSLGTVRVLNAARQQEASADAVRAIASASAPESAKPSDVSRDDLVVADAECALMYNELKARHDALVDAELARQKALGTNVK